MWRLILSCNIAYAALAVSFCQLAYGADTANYRVTGPISHRNLSIYFVHGTSEPGPVPLTLQEAMKMAAVRVHETGHVSRLAIENTSDKEVFVQSGDIVKGGKQDRVLTMSLLLPPKSGRVPISALCVEQGRWRARGREDLKRFASSLRAVPSRDLKIAMKTPALANAPATTGALSGPAELTGRQMSAASAQHEVWRNVRKTQERLSKSLGGNIAAAASPSSLQLALEDDALKRKESDYLRALKMAGEKDGDIVGFVFAINGKLNSADIYPSNALFRKMWTKNLRASVTEAIAERDTTLRAEPPGLAGVRTFLDSRDRGKARTTDVTADVELQTSDLGNAYFFDTRRRNGNWVHRNYLAKH